MLRLTCLGQPQCLLSSCSNICKRLRAGISQPCLFPWSARRRCMESGKRSSPWKLINPPVCWEKLEPVNIRAATSAVGSSTGTSTSISTGWHQYYIQYCTTAGPSPLWVPVLPSVVRNLRAPNEDSDQLCTGEKGLHINVPKGPCPTKVRTRGSARSGKGSLEARRACSPADVFDAIRFLLRQP